MTNQQPNWEEIRREWETTKITFKELADKYGLKDSTIRSRKSREKWQRNIATETATQQQNVATKEDISWIDIENEYVTDIRKRPCTLKDLAIKYNISYDYLRKYAAENNWKDKRELYITKTTQKTIEKSAEIISNDLSQVLARHYKVSDKLLSAIESALEDNLEFYKYVEKLKSGDEYGYEESIEMHVLGALNESKLLTVVNAMEKIQKMQRQTLNIFDAKEQANIDKLKAETARIKGDDDSEYEDDGFLEALNKVADDVWSDEDNEDDRDE